MPEGMCGCDCLLLRVGQTLGYVLKVNDAPDGLQVVRADVLVLQVVSVFPDLKRAGEGHGAHQASNDP